MKMIETTKTDDTSKRVSIKYNIKTNSHVYLIIVYENGTREVMEMPL